MTSGSAAMIGGVGAQTAIGRDAWSTAAAARAGISGFICHPTTVDRAGEPLHVAMCSWLDERLQGADRLEALLLPALEEASAGWDAVGTDALVLGLSQERAGISQDVAAELASRVRRRCKGWLRRLVVLPHGHAAGLLALEAAAERVMGGEWQRCLVAAVDSHLDPSTLRCLEDRSQIHGAGMMNNAWGFVPGEGAAALMLCRADHAAPRETPGFGSVLGTGKAVEAQCIGTEGVCIGSGLTAAITAALTAVPPGHRVSDIYCDLNGEPYRSDEYAFAVLRMNDELQSAGDFTAAADCWGDVGAAGGILNVAYACIRFAKRLAKGPLALVWASSESGERSAVLLREG